MSTPADKTRVDLARAALTEIRVLRGGEAPTAVQQAQSDQKYDSIYAELGHLGVAFWTLHTQPLYRELQIWQRLERPDWTRIAEFLRLGIPGGLAVMVEVTSFTLMALLIARMGTVPSPQKGS